MGKVKSESKIKIVWVQYIGNKDIIIIKSSTNRGELIMIIGVISDTHGLLRAEAIENLKDCDLIVHCGDIGKLEIIEKLEQLARVEFIRGNIDKKINHKIAPIDKIIEVMNKRIYLVHNIAEMDVDLEKENIDIVVYGHSHKANVYEKDDVLYINPGSIGPRRFKLPITMAKLTILDYDNNIDSKILEENIFIWKCYKVEQITIDV